MMAAFVLHLLGDPVLQGPEGPVTGRAAYRRRLALLSILAVARGRPVGRERIIGLLWPESPADAARHTLSEALYVLRKDLAEELFTAMGDEIALNPAVVGSDVADFEEAVAAGRPEDAVRAYRGAFLDGFYVADAPEFERWAEGERDRLSRLFAQALEGLAMAAEAGGDAAAAVEWWRRLASHDRYSSRVALRLVRALDAAGDRMAALRFAGAHAVLLREELGAEPDRELAALVKRLRDEPAPALAQAAQATAAPAADPEAAGTAEAENAPASQAVDSAREVSAASAESTGSAAPPAPVAVESPELAAPPAAATAESGARARRWGPRRAAAAGGAAVALVVAALAISRPAAAPEAPRYDPRRVAVLYLDDHSPGGELGYLADGLTEMLIHELAQVEALDVVSRNGVRPYHEHAVPMDSLAADLRAGTLVEGSVQRSGDSVRVTVQLIDTNTQVHLESRAVVLPLDPGHLFALQDAVAAEVSAALRRRVGQEIRMTRLRREAGDPRALELVLRASQARTDGRELARSAHPRDMAAALRVLQAGDSLAARAERLDGGWSEPVLLRGWLALERGRITPVPRQLPVYQQALARADEVLRRRPGDVDARELRGTALWLMVLAAPEAARDRPWLAQAERELRAVVAADPERASAWGTLGQLLRLGGDLAEGDLAARRAREADAYLQVAEVGAERLYRTALTLGDLPRARHWCAEGRRGFPLDYRFRECELVLLARDTSAVPRPDSAWRLLAAADRVDPPATAAAAARPYSPVFRRMMVAAVLARAGLPDSARAVSARARAAVRGDPEVLTSYLWDEAYLQLLLGDRRRAAALLDTFVARRPVLRGYVAREPAFRGLARP
ncbi:MAG TPA: BTAD domain-containing putative transcriptional regulator [Longimicrobium sp.]|nr:BTAD domain-containing putative transcriptional regulator [Longimicrobium sp.]